MKSLVIVLLMSTLVGSSAFALSVKEAKISGETSDKSTRRKSDKMNGRVSRDGRKAKKDKMSSGRKLGSEKECKMIFGLLQKHMDSAAANVKKGKFKSATRAVKQFRILRKEKFFPLRCRKALKLGRNG